MSGMVSRVFSKSLSLRHNYASFLFLVWREPEEEAAASKL